MKALDLSEALGGVPQELIDLGLEKQAAHSSKLATRIMAAVAAAACLVLAVGSVSLIAVLRKNRDNPQKSDTSTTAEAGSVTTQSQSKAVQTTEPQHSGDETDDRMQCKWMEFSPEINGKSVEIQALLDGTNALVELSSGSITGRELGFLRFPDGETMQYEKLLELGAQQNLVSCSERYALLCEVKSPDGGPENNINEYRLYDLQQKKMLPVFRQTKMDMSMLGSDTHFLIDGDTVYCDEVTMKDGVPDSSAVYAYHAAEGRLIGSYLGYQQPVLYQGTVVALKCDGEGAFRRLCSVADQGASYQYDLYEEPEAIQSNGSRIYALCRTNAPAETKCFLKEVTANQTLMTLPENVLSFSAGDTMIFFSELMTGPAHGHCLNSFYDIPHGTELSLPSLKNLSVCLNGGTALIRAEKTDDASPVLVRVTISDTGKQDSGQTTDGQNTVTTGPDGQGDDTDETLQTTPDPFEGSRGTDTKLTETEQSGTKTTEPALSALSFTSRYQFCQWSSDWRDEFDEINQNGMWGAMGINRLIQSYDELKGIKLNTDYMDYTPEFFREHALIFCFAEFTELGSRPEVSEVTLQKRSSTSGLYDITVKVRRKAGMEAAMQRWLCFLEVRNSDLGELQNRDWYYATVNVDVFNVQTNDDTRFLSGSPGGYYEWFDSSHSAFLSRDLHSELIASPDLSFRAEDSTVSVLKGGKSVFSVYGRPLVNAYFTDLNGDGMNELCVTWGAGSGRYWQGVSVYDIKNDVSYRLDDNSFDYTLKAENGKILVKRTEDDMMYKFDPDYAFYVTGSLQIRNGSLVFTQVAGMPDAAQFKKELCAQLNELKYRRENGSGETIPPDFRLDDGAGVSYLITDRYVWRTDTGRWAELPDELKNRIVANGREIGLIELCNE